MKNIIKRTWNTLWIGAWSMITNADYEVITKNRHTLRGIQSTGLLLLGLMCTLFGLQFMALSTFTGDNNFSLIAAGLSVLILIILDRIVIDSDCQDEGRIEYLIETHPQSTKIPELKKKRNMKMLVRVFIGVTIAYIAATLSVPKLLQYEINASIAATEAEINADAIARVSDYHRRQVDMISSIDNQIASIESELVASRLRDSEHRSHLIGDIRGLQEERRALREKVAFAENCAQAEIAGRDVAGCNYSGEKGPGENYSYWMSQASANNKLVENLTTAINESESKLSKSAELMEQSRLKARVAELREEQQRIRSSISSDTDNMKENMKQTGEYQALAIYGPVANSIQYDKVMMKASPTAHHSLLLIKVWVMVLELAVFAAKLCGSTKDYSLALYRESLRRRAEAKREHVYQNLSLAA